jgi:protein TonB
MSAVISKQMPYLARRKKPDNLSFWLFVAAIIHTIVLIGVTFSSPSPAPISKAIEVTIVNSKAKKPPENAKYLAQSNQIGAGIENQKPTLVEKKKPSLAQDAKQQQQITATNQIKIEHRLITRKTAAEKMPSAQQAEPEQTQDKQDQQSQPEMSMEELDRQIAQLGAKVEELKESADKTRIKSINAVSAHKYAAADYVKEWDRKVEGVGNSNYPVINGRKDFSATLSMEVGIGADGSIYDIKILKSSGSIELDKAAQQIVENSAPFPPLPESITQELDVLSIRREWSFSQEAISSSD